MRGSYHPVISLFLTLSLLTSAVRAVEFAGGTGEPDDPYQIATAEQLSELTENPGLWDRHFKLVADIDLVRYEGTTFPPIGRWQSAATSHPFRGSFDGGGYEIANLNQTCWDTDDVGLFGYVAGSDAEIRNLTLISPHVYARNGENVGSLVGRLGSGAIRNCHVNRAIVLAEGGSCVGSLVGRVQEGTVENCHATLGLVVGGDCVGGLVGMQSGAVARCHAAGDISGQGGVGGLIGSSASGSRIENCYSFANVTGTNGVGGLIGSNAGVVINAYSAGVVSGKVQVGGLIGAAGGQADTIECFWDIQTSGRQNSAGGRGRTTSEMRTLGVFLRWSGCGSEAVWTILEGQDYPRLAWEGRPGTSIALMPLVGEGTKEAPYLIRSAEELNRIGLMACTWSGHFQLTADVDLADFRGGPFYVIGTGQIPFTGVFDGGGHAIFHFRQSSTDPNYAGLFGYVNGPEAEIRDLMLIDPNVGGMTILVADPRGKYNQAATGCVGALAGRVERGRIVRCGVVGGSVSAGTVAGGLVGHNHGMIAASYAESGVSGSSLAGGLVGSNTGTIQNSYAMGTVTGGYGGGLVGGNAGSIAWCYAACETPQYTPGSGSARRLHVASPVACPLAGRSESSAEIFCSFWDARESGQSGVTGINARNTEQMRTAATFVGWGACDNDGTWTIDDGRDYPRLSWQGLGGEPIGPVRLSDLLAGTGTAEDPYLIATADDLLLMAWFRCDWDGHFRLMTDIDLVTGTMIEPIGSGSLPFTGVFDGGGHCLSHLTWRWENQNHVGLFRHVADPNARIVNLRLLDPNVMVVGGGDVGALVGWLEDGCIADCYVDGGFVTFKGMWDDAVGGLVGRLDRGRISDSYCTCTVTSGDNLAGGVVGCNHAGQIIRCRYAGTLAGEHTLGGVAGWNSGVLFACSATGQMNLEYRGRTVGGLVGWNYGLVTSSYAACAIEASGADEAGGLVAHNRGAINNCYATGSITWGRLDDMWGNDAVGGLVGGNDYSGSIVNCYAVSKLSHKGPTKPIDGFVGEGPGRRLNCFFSMDVSSGGSDPVRIGLSDEQIADVNTYVESGWDFTGESANGTSDLWEMPFGAGGPALVCFSEAPRRHALLGAGTAEDPYQIATPEDLGAVCQYDRPARFVLTSDIDLSAVAWSAAPIPAFNGHVDGAGFVISNLSIYGGGYLGLFGVLGRHARIENLGIEDANIALTHYAEFGGILAGRNQGSIGACYAAGALRTEVYYHWATGLGGLVGYNDGDIADCYCRIGIGGRLWYSGGLAGENAGRLARCYAVAHVLPGWELQGFEGLVNADRGGRVVHCFWDVQTSEVGGSAAGRGLTTTQMQTPDVYSLNGWAAGSQWVLDPGRDYPRLAWENTPGDPIPEPVIDWLEGAGTSDEPYRVASPEQLALIAAAGVLWDEAFVLTADLDLAGIDWLPIGVCAGSDFTGSFDGAGHVIRNLGIDATGTSRSRLGLFGWIGSEGKVRRLGLRDATIKGGDGSNCLGVLAGGNTGRVTQCYASGVIIGGESAHGIGGLVGVNSQGEIEDSYATVNISGGSSVVGGLIGENDRGALTRCYVAAQVGGRHGSDYFGGLIGDDESGQITVCYFMRSRTLSGRRGDYVSFIAPDNGLGIPLQEPQMQQQASFVGWDFGGVWTICEGNGYPHLQWEHVACQP